MIRYKKEVNFVEKGKVKLIKKPLNIIRNTIVVKNKYSMISPGTELALFTKTHIGFTDSSITWCEYPIAVGYTSVGEVIYSKSEKYNIGDIVLHFSPHSDYQDIDVENQLCFKIPKSMQIEKSLFTKFAQISYTALALSQKRSGIVLVFGSGMIGNFCAQLYKNITKREVIIVDIYESRLDFSKKCGLYTINSSKQDIKKELKRYINGVNNVFTVIEATGNPNVVNQCLELVAPYGEVMLLGSSRGTVEVDIYKNIHRKFLTVFGAHENRYNINEKRKFCVEILKEINDSQLMVDGYITDYIKVNEIEKAYNLLLNDKDHHLGIVIDWE